LDLEGHGVAGTEKLTDASSTEKLTNARSTVEERRFSAA
jgi:hypothetical protein